MSQLVHNSQIVLGFAAVDLQTAANEGDFVCLNKFNHVAVIFHSAIGTAGDDPTLVLQQATTVAGGGVKDLDFTRIYTKQAATDLTAVANFTLQTQTAATNFTDTDAAEQMLIWVVEFDAAELDVDNGFDCIRATVADVGSNAQLGALFYILTEPSYAASEANISSAIA